MKKIIPLFVLLFTGVAAASAQTGATAHVTVTQVPCALGVQTPEPVYNLRVFPNPANTFFQVNLQSDQLIGKMEVVVFNLLGQQMLTRSEQVNGRKTQLEVSTAEMKAGTYFIRISTPGFSKVERITINN